MSDKIGYVNQYESMGNLDGPGTRFVVFLQGCPLRCQYCHNPETFEFSTDKKYQKTTSEVVEAIGKLRSFYLNGGVTISGGEPLMQIDFIIELAKKIKKELKLHVAIDTSGAPFTKDNIVFMDKFNELLEYVDLFLVDIKHIDEEKAKQLTTKSNKNELDMLKYLNEVNKPVWIRYVLVPGISDDPEDLKATGTFINTLSNIENVDILPYHNMAEAKWAQEGLKYQLSSVRNANKDDVLKAYDIMFGYKKSS